MNNKHYWSMLALAIISGFVGGAVASRVFTYQEAFAQKKSSPIEVIEAQEFRLVDENGKTRARVSMQDGKVLTEIPQMNKMTIKFLKEAKGEQ